MRKKLAFADYKYHITDHRSQSFIYSYIHLFFSLPHVVINPINNVFTNKTPPTKQKSTNLSYQLTLNTVIYFN